MAFLLPISLMQFFDNSGNIASGALAHVYEVGTTTDKDTFTTASLLVNNSNPLEADSSGRFPLAYIDDGESFKLVITDSSGGTTFYTADDLESPSAPEAAAGTYTSKSTDYTVVAADHASFIDFDASGGDRTATVNSVTLGNGFEVTIGRRSSTGLVTIAPGGGQTIDGQSSYIIDTDYEAVTLFSMGATGWRIKAITSRDPLGEIAGINEQTDAYTLVISDKGKLVIMSKATAVIATIPPNSSVPFPINTVIFFRAGDAGQVEIESGSGVTIDSAVGTSASGAGDDLLLVTQDSGAFAIKTGTNSWWLSGDITV